jgi:hypothetical protein
MVSNSRAANDSTRSRARIQAANSLARLISTSYVMVQDIDVENIEEEIENLKQTMKEHEEDQDLGYYMEGEDGQTLEWDTEKKEWVPKTEKPKN